MARPAKTGKGVTFSPASARRIARAVMRVERGGGDRAGTQLRTSGDGAEINRGTFTAPWAKGTTKTVTDAILTSVTYENVNNYFAAVAGTGSKACAIAFVGGEWILIAAECG